MRLMARVGETFELAQVHRFTHEWERDASLRLRAGDVEVLDVYAAHGRIYGGTAEANETRAVRLALADHLAGQRSVHPGRHQRAGRPSSRPVPGRTGGLRAGRSRRRAPQRRQPGRRRRPHRHPGQRPDHDHQPRPLRDQPIRLPGRWPATGTGP